MHASTPGPSLPVILRQPFGTVIDPPKAGSDDKRYQVLQPCHCAAHIVRPRDRHLTSSHGLRGTQLRLGQKTRDTSRTFLSPSVRDENTAGRVQKLTTASTLHYTTARVREGVSVMVREGLYQLAVKSGSVQFGRQKPLR